MNTETQQPTPIRHLVLGVTAVMSIFMYVDRVCIAQVSGDIKADLCLTDAEMDWVKSAFFWSYALSQVPAGVLGIRFGQRRMMAMCLFLWSFFTVTSGVAAGFAALIASRLAVGVTEAGAYPNAAALVKAWFPVSSRGFANSVVSLGGRFGGAMGQRMTAPLVVLFTGVIVWNGVAVAGWRVVLGLFGVLGMLWAFVVFWVIRDHPSQHPWANAEEAGLAGAVAHSPVPPDTEEQDDRDNDRESPIPHWLESVVVFLGSRNLWAFGLMQFFINLGWAFIITQFPDYLEKVHGKTGSEKGYLSSMPGFVGLAGLFTGGFLTDWLVRRGGIRRGRILPILLGAGTCGSAFVFCATTDSVWAVVAALCFVTLGTDLAIPAMWAIAQDIGGRHVGPVLGYGNMWGNFGAACCPLLLGWVQREFGWPAMFMTASASFGLAMGLVLLINAEKPLRANG